MCAAVVVPGCLALAWWQASRALSGNTLSWAYTFEWPVFAGYALYMWWRLWHEPALRDAPAPVPVADAPVPAHGAPAAVVRPERSPQCEQAPGRRPDDAPDEDAALAEYNDYLAALGTSGRRKRW